MKSILALIGLGTVIYLAAKAWDKHVEQKWAANYGRKTAPAAE